MIDELTDRLVSAYGRLPIGNPMEDGTLVGPLIHRAAYEGDGGGHRAGRRARAGHRGRRRRARLDTGAADAYYAEPSIVRIDQQTDVVQRETFAPLLYVLPYDDFAEAIALNNAVPRGCPRASSPPTRRRPSGSSPPRGRTAGSSTSTSARPAPRSVARSAGRRRPAAAASPAPTPGAPTCAGRPTRSTTPASCRSPRVWTSRSEPPGRSGRRVEGRDRPPLPG